MTRNGSDDVAAQQTATVSDAGASPSGARPGAPDRTEGPGWAQGTRWRLLVAGLGAAAFIGNLAGSWTPEPWRDEAATWFSTQRSPAELLAMLGSVDAVHGMYYFSLRAWGLVFGDSVFSLRAYSALGVAVGVALVMLVAVRMFGPMAAIGAGISYGVLPPVTWAATEARSYAWAAALSCAVALAFWVAQSRNGWAWWAVYGVVVVVAVHGFVYNLLPLAAVLLTLPWLRAGRRLRAVVATGLAVLACAPFVYLVSTQSGQVSWLATYPVTVTDVTMGVLWGTVATAQLAGTVLLVLALAVVGHSFVRGHHRAAIAYVIGWLLLPLLVLMAVHPVVQLYHRRYLLISVPALALVLGVLFARLNRVWLRALLVVLIVAICVPGYLKSREDDSKLTAAPAADQLAAHSVAGDGLYVVGADVNALDWSFPDEVRRLVNLSTPATDQWRSEELFPPSVPVEQLGSRLDDVRRVWVWSDADRVDDAVAAFARDGFDEVDRVRGRDHYQTVLVLVERWGA